MGAGTRGGSYTQTPRNKQCPHRAGRNGQKKPTPVTPWRHCGRPCNLCPALPSARVWQLLAATRFSRSRSPRLPVFSLFLSPLDFSQSVRLAWPLVHGSRGDEERLLMESATVLAQGSQDCHLWVTLSPTGGQRQQNVSRTRQDNSLDAVRPIGIEILRLGMGGNGDRKSVV